MPKIIPLEKIEKIIDVPPDKSISHRAVMISCLSEGQTEISPFLNSIDTLASLDCMRKLGAKIEYLPKERKVFIEGRGIYFPKSSLVELHTQDSGTTMRLLSGILAGQRFSSLLNCGHSLQRRPMKRITVPLRMMGANVKGRSKNNEEYPPLQIEPVEKLYSIDYKMSIGSAQVKSAIIFASLYSEGVTKIRELFLTRDHTERMLAFFKGKIKKQGKLIICEKSRLISPQQIFIPGDFSSASFFIVLGLILRDSQLFIKNVGINPTRIGLLKVLKRMGANLKIFNKRDYFEPYADILVKSSFLKGVEVNEEEVPLMIDEIPILLVAASFAEGETVVYGAKELRVKETDRISSMVTNLKKAGVEIKAKSYGAEKNWMIIVKGSRRFKQAKFHTFLDHRTAMSLIIFSLASGKENYIDEVKSINKSFPEFLPLINSLYS